MSSAKQSKILSSLYLALKPIVRMLLRAGIGYREFSEIAKAAYVDEASTGYGLRGRPTNISRIAVMTGISRKEIGQLKKTSIGDLSTASISRAPGSQVLAHWHFDPDYLDSNSKPVVLEFDGQEISFSSLVKAYGGDLPPGAMRSELLRIGAIEELETGGLKAVKQDFCPAGLDDRLSLGLNSIVNSSVATLDHNCDPKNADNLLIQVLVSSEQVSEDRFVETRMVAREKLNSLCDDFESYLTNIERESSLTDSTGTEVGIGLYYYEIPTDKN